ncbi:MAG: LuxR C-terminal-related transcriptional regulator [Pseudomonadota bacterium]
MLERVAAGECSRVQSRNLEILNRVLLGQLPKVVAHDLKIAISTVATGTQHCVRSLGLPKRPPNLPILLIMAARAAERVALTPALGRLTRTTANNEKHWLVSVERPDLEFPVALSEAEGFVVRRLVSGRTHAEISTDRATSPRTVANQLANVFKKFGVSGRSALVQRLITYSFERQAARLGASYGPLFSLPGAGARALNGS